MTELIDVHHHFLPERYAEALRRSGNDRPDGIGSLPQWSEREAIGFLDDARIEKALLSISSPGVLLDDCDAAELARIVNDEAAELVVRWAGRFGGFASLPLPDVENSVLEVARALDTLDLDGVVLLTHYGNTYLGDPALDPVFDELNRRDALVFLHPTSPVCCDCTALGFPRPAIEFMFDTTRAVTNLIYSGTIDRCPRISWIVPHAGAALPVLASRIDMLRLMAPERCNASEPVADYLARFYYDLAGPRTEDALRALLGIAEPSRILYGSDWPFTPAPAVAYLLGALNRTRVFDAAEVEAVMSGNARRLLSRSRIA
jgi:predicted TIM-barrel fold metal-dependent hydrolase